MLLDALLRTSVDVGRYEEAERRRDVVDLEDEVARLQRGRRVIGQILRELGEAAQDGEADGEVLGQVGQRRVRHCDDEHLARAHELEGLGGELFLRDLEELSLLVLFFPKWFEVELRIYKFVHWTSGYFSVFSTVRDP